MTTSSRAWSTPEDIRAKVHRRWQDGSLLVAHALGEPFPVIEVPLRGPKVSDLGDRLEETRQWIARLEAGQRGGARYELTWTVIGGRHFGRNRIPARAVVNRYDQAWSLLDVSADVSSFDEIWAVCRAVPTARDWVLAHPHKVLALGTDWPAVLAAYQWLDENRGSARYLREISAPGVDTKFAERHRGVLAALLGVSARAGGFADDLGLRRKPELLRLRVSPELGFPSALSELALRKEELARLDVGAERAVIVENEITYLSVPVPHGGVVIWGQGYAVDRVDHLPWLRDAQLTYWGDLDTHGFVILDRLRSRLPRTRSVLMDRETLLAHGERWTVEPQSVSVALRHLTDDEQDLYRDLVEDRLGDRVRLEQELIDWQWARKVLAGVDG